MISGALNPESRRAMDYASEKYESIRKQNTDCYHIAKNTNFSYEIVSLIKGHIFYNKHILTGEYPNRFHASYEMAQSWERLSAKNGKHIKPHDILMLYHELLEIQYITQGYSQQEAHYLASQKYDYGKACREYYRSLGFNY